MRLIFFLEKHCLLWMMWLRTCALRSWYVLMFEGAAERFRAFSEIQGPKRVGSWWVEAFKMDMVFLPVTSVQSNLHYNSLLIFWVHLFDRWTYQIVVGLPDTRWVLGWLRNAGSTVWSHTVCLDTDWLSTSRRCATVDLLGDITLDRRNAIRAVGPGKAITVALGRAPRWHLCCNQLEAFWSNSPACRLRHVSLCCLAAVTTQAVL